MIRIQTLGTVRILRDGEEIDALLRQKLRCALLIYVSIERETTRDLAAAMFWPDREPDRARHALSQTTYELRRTLGDDVVDTTGERLRVAPALTVDTIDFEAAIEARDFERAIKLYEGPFMHGFNLGASHAFELWTDTQAAQLVRLHRRARRELIEQHVQKGDQPAALAAARGWVEIDPMDDEGQHGYIQLLAMGGNRTAALRQFEQYERLLAADELAPLDATVELARRLRSGQLESWIPISESQPGVQPAAPDSPAAAATADAHKAAPPAADPAPPAADPAPTMLTESPEARPMSRARADFEARLRQGVQPELEILRPLGRSSTAVVYLARESSLHRLVAVKALKPEFAVDDVARKRFQREAQSAARISHSNVTTVHRVGALADGIPYIVMEYIDGRTLGAAVDATGPLSMQEARKLLGSLASALAAAHAKGIVHRDVRPANVFIEKRTGRAVLADFGIAALLETGSEVVTRLTAEGMRLGELQYMSPEQVHGEPVTEQSDVYAFGILAYECLTGRGPYEARRNADFASAHLNQEPQRLERLRADVDPGLAHLIERCLAKDPNRRPRAAEIASLLAGPPNEPVPLPTVRTTSALAHFLHELRRRRVYQVTAGYIVLLVGVNELGDSVGLSAGFTDIVVNVLVIAFPVVLVLSWVYDITASGITRTEASGEAESGIGRFVPWVALALSVVVSAFFAYIFFWR